MIMKRISFLIKNSFMFLKLFPVGRKMASQSTLITDVTECHQVMSLTCIFLQLVFVPMKLSKNLNYLLRHLEYSSSLQ
jgi:hypothetical protein